MTMPTQTDGNPLAGLGLENVPDGLPEGAYPGNLYDVKVIEHKGEKTGKKSLVFTYKVNNPGHVTHGETIDDFKSCNADDSNQQKRFLKMRLESLGVPESRFSDPTWMQAVIGLDVYFTVKKNGQYTNVSKVERRGMAASNGTPTGNVANGTASASGDISSLL